VKVSFYILIFSILTSVSAPVFGFQEGYASWYGGKFHGRLTASGERFDTNMLTAAHKTLPFGTVVKVTNIANGRFTFVRINDRGPFVAGRIIDLSRAAAQEIGMLSMGVALVRLDIVSGGKNSSIFAVQIGAFKNQKNAEKIKKDLEKNKFPVVLRYSDNGIIRVIVENIVKGDLESTLRKLSDLGYYKPLVKHEVIKK